MWQPSGFPHLYYIHPCQKCQIHFDRNCPGETVCVFAEGFPMIQPGSARLPRARSALAMTSLGALHIRRKYLQICSCQRRSLTAATDAIGAYRFHGGLYKSAVPSRDCHVASLLAMTRQGSARCISALLPLNIPYKAVTDRRYTPYFGVCRFHGRLYGAGVRSRERHAAPLQCTAESLVQLSTFHSRLSTSIPLLLYT